MSGSMLVTGGAGFIGSHIVDSLIADGYRVRVLDDLSTGRLGNLDRRAELVIADVSDAAAVAAAMDGVAGVFHLAAVASVARGNQDWFGTHRVNQSGTVAVLEAARSAGGGRTLPLPVVYASSAAIYGDTGKVAAHEGLVPNPVNAYGADKLGSELHARIGSSLHHIPTLGLRFFNVYGPRQDPSSPYSGVISIFARRVAAGEAIILHGDGSQTRDFVHVSDVVAHLRAAMNHLLAARNLPNAVARSLVLNVCSGRAVSVADLGLMLFRLHGIPPRMEQGPVRPGDIHHSRGWPAAAEAALGVRATTSLEVGLKTLAPAGHPVHSAAI